MRPRGGYAPRVRSGVSGVVWPPVSRGAPAALAALLDQFEHSQWLDPAAIRAGQFRQLRMLADHAAAHSPHFARRLRAAGLSPAELATPEGLVRLAPLLRRDIQAAADLDCDPVPADHLPVKDAHSSGSTGEPVRIRTTAVKDLLWLAHMVRDEVWHRRALTARRCSIRATTNELHHFPSWGGLAGALFETGEVLVIPAKMPMSEQIALIDRYQPESLLAYPNLFAALLDACRARGRGFEGLRHLRTLGETVSPKIREELSAFFGAQVTDSYSSQEAGYLALQCPDGPLYHLMAESVIVELIRDDGTVCEEGETGRVLVTDLHNFATPLIRYDLGDFAEAGPPCPCGRGLPTLRRILGRNRNFVRLPDGRSHWPWFSMEHLRDSAPIRQFQLIQHSLERVEVRLTCDRPLTGAEEAGLRAAIGRALNHDFALDLHVYDTPLPTSPSGKFEEFICLMA